MIHGKILQLKDGICQRRDLDDDAATMSLFTFPDISGMVILETANASLNISRQLVVTQNSQQGHLHLSSSPYTNPAIQI
jgi:hypothetical protein